MIRYVPAQVIAAFIIGAIGIAWLALIFAVVALLTAAIAFKNTSELFDLIADDSEEQSDRAEMVAANAATLHERMSKDA